MGLIRAKPGLESPTFRAQSKSSAKFSYPSQHLSYESKILNDITFNHDQFTTHQPQLWPTQNTYVSHPISLQWLTSFQNAEEAAGTLLSSQRGVCLS